MVKVDRNTAWMCPEDFLICSIEKKIANASGRNVMLLKYEYSILNTNDFMLFSRLQL